MTLAVEYPLTTHTATGSSGDFTVGFSCSDDSDLIVTRIIGGEAQSPDLPGIHYIVTGDLEAGGGVVSYQPSHVPGAGVVVEIRRATPVEQPSPFGDLAKFMPRYIERGFDRAFRVLQEIMIAVDGGLRGERGAKGDPGGNVMAVGLFSALSTLSIPNGTDIIRTSGWAVSGFGAAHYRVGASTDPAAAETRHSTNSANGRPIYLEEVFPLVEHYGASSTPGADVTTAVQAALDHTLVLGFRNIPTGYRLTSPVNLRSGHRIFGGGAKVYRDNQNDHLFKLVSVNDIEIRGLHCSHSFVNFAEDRSNKSLVYGLESSNVSVIDCKFTDVGLFAVSSDISGPGWQIALCRFDNLSGTAVDIRGGTGHVIADNRIVDTGDDAIAVADHMGRVTVTGNVIENPGQTSVGGGGIRTNGVGAVIANNSIFNANLFFISVASLIADGTARPDHTLVKGNVGIGIKPTTNNTTAALLIRNAQVVDCEGNFFDPRGLKDVSIVNVVNNGASRCRVTTAAPHGYTTGNRVRIEGAGGVGNGESAITVISSTVFDLNSVVFSGSYTGGGVAYNAIHLVRLYTSQQTTKNRRIRIRGNTARGFEAAIALQTEYAVENLECVDNDLENFTSGIAVASGAPVANEIKFCRNQLRDPRQGAILNRPTDLTVNRLILNDNEVIMSSGAPAIPLQFGGATVAYSEALRNKLGAPGPTSEFEAIGNVDEFLFDGDYSVRRYNQGAAMIAAGDTSVTVSHGMTYQPRPGEIRVMPTTGTPACVLQARNVFSTTFEVVTTEAPDVNINFNWLAAPVVRRYVSGVLAA